MSGRQHDQVPEVDLPALNPDQRSGVTCINCGTRRGPMRSIVTPSNRESTIVFVIPISTCACAASRGTSPSCIRASPASPRTRVKRWERSTTWKTNRDACRVGPPGVGRFLGGREGRAEGRGPPAA